MNSLLNPLGPSALSFRRFFTIESISALVKGFSSHSKFVLHSRKKLRLKAIAVYQISPICLYMPPREPFPFLHDSPLFPQFLSEICYQVVAMLDGCICMKEFSSSVTFFYPFGFASLFPINFLLFQ